MTALNSLKTLDNIVNSSISNVPTKKSYLFWKTSDCGPLQLNYNFGMTFTHIGTSDQFYCHCSALFSNMMILYYSHIVGAYPISLWCSYCMVFPSGHSSFLVLFYLSWKNVSLWYNQILLQKLQINNFSAANKIFIIWYLYDQPWFQGKSMKFPCGNDN